MALRLGSTNVNIDRSTFGFITNPSGRATFEKTAKFAGGAFSIWDTVKGETEISRQVNDNRVFGGVWAYMVLVTWGPDEEGTYAIDLTVDPYPQATTGKVVITASFFCDVCARWPVPFSFSPANVLS